jgi:hypothetical protein
MHGQNENNFNNIYDLYRTERRMAQLGQQLLTASGKA